MRDRYLSIKKGVRLLDWAMGLLYIPSNLTDCRDFDNQL